MRDDSASQCLNVVICDDNAAILEELLLLAKAALSPQWEASFFTSTSPEPLLEAADPIHIAVLDIELPNEDGILFARRLLQRNPDCRILFVSGYLRYVSSVYDVPHLGMVLKDQLEAHLPRFLLRAAGEVCSEREKLLAVSLNGKQIKLPLSGVLCLERREHNTFIRLASGQEVRTREKLGPLLSQRACGELCRCHVSYAVNLSKVADMQGRDFIMADGTRIPISRGYLPSARDAYFGYLTNSAQPAWL